MKNLNEYDVVMFSTTICGPCKITKPIVEKASIENNIDTKFYIVDLEENGRDIAVEFGVRSVPTTIFFQNGKEVGRKVGALKETDFLELYNSYLLKS